MVNSIYIRFAWRVLVGAILCYCCTYIRFPGDSAVVMGTEITIADLIYYNSLNVSMFLGSLVASNLAFILASDFKIKQLFIIRYLCYSSSAILFIRMCFHFFKYAYICNQEIYVYIFISMCILGGFLNEIKKLK